MQPSTIEIISVQVGGPKHLANLDRELTTAIDKQPTCEPLYLGTLNLAGDVQVNVKYHGGKDRAVHLYPYEHYAFWEQEFGMTFAPGVFGENLTVRGMTEEHVCLGDTYQWGDTLLQVTETRIPCVTIDMMTNAPGIFTRFKETGYTGYFFRVLREGMVSHASLLTLVQRHPAGITLAHLNHILFHDVENIEEIGRILAVDELADQYRTLFEGRLQKLSQA